MKVMTRQLADGVYAIVLEDMMSWDVTSYANLYVIKRDGKIILIDAGAKSYSSLVRDELAQLGIVPEAVTHVIMTHGHWDHVGGAGAFTAAKKWIHALDKPMLPQLIAGVTTAFSATDSPQRFCVPDLPDLDIIHVNTHTPGSCAVFDRVSGALFIGDFFCYFGEALPEGELVCYSETSRRGSCQYVAEQARSGSWEAVHFLKGLQRLLALPARFFCTGHGVILQDDIQAFLQDMYEAGRQAEHTR